MKSETSLRSAQDGALKQALEASDELSQTLDILWHDTKAAGHQMPTVRALLAELNQRVHEFNAYHNALTTE